MALNLRNTKFRIDKMISSDQKLQKNNNKT